MKPNMNISPKAFSLLCSICGGQILRTIVGNDPDVLQWRCNQCQTEYGPEWNRSLLGDKPNPSLVGPKAWPKPAPQTVLKLAKVAISYVLSYAAALAALLL